MYHFYGKARPYAERAGEKFQKNRRLVGQKKDAEEGNPRESSVSLEPTPEPDSWRLRLRGCVIVLLCLNLLEGMWAEEKKGLSVDAQSAIYRF
jgi:hypothetical protein